MASGKETPRQKMISLMYLVLMAMLAMNVTKDVLDAFVTVNQSLLTSEANATAQNDLVFQNIEKAFALDNKKVKKEMERAQEIRSNTEEILQKIRAVKAEVIAAAEQITVEQADTIHAEYLTMKDDYDTPTYVMVGPVEDASQGKGRELYNAINDYKAGVKSLFSESELQTLNLGLELNGGISGEKEVNWEIYNFDHTPLVATVTILSKLENDIRSAEYNALNRLLANIGENDFTFDTIAAKVISPSNYVLLGEEYQSEVFLAAFSTTQSPEIVLNEQELNVENGVGKYSVKTNKEGFFTYNGNITVKKKNGEEKTYPFESEYMVAKPSLTVSPTKMNVLYVGIDNPISISVPGVANENINARISHGSLKKTGNGTYSVTPPRAGAPNTATVNVSATMPDGSSRSMGSMEFRLKRVPNPQIVIRGKSSNFNFSKGEMRQITKIRAVHGEDFVFDGSAEMIYCEILVSTNKGPKKYECPNGILPQNARNYFQNVNKGTIINIINIKAKGMDGSTRKLDSQVIRVK